MAMRSVRLAEPVLIWPVLRPTARSAMVVSSVSPERCEMTALKPAFSAMATASSVSVSVPIWLSLTSTEFATPSRMPRAMISGGGGTAPTLIKSSASGSLRVEIQDSDVINRLRRLRDLGIRVCIECDDPDHPSFGRMIDNAMSWGLDNPDCNYTYTRVRGDTDYRIEFPDAQIQSSERSPAA